MIPRNPSEVIRLTQAVDDYYSESDRLITTNLTNTNNFLTYMIQSEEFRDFINEYIGGVGAMCFLETFKTSPNEIAQKWIYNFSADPSGAIKGILGEMKKGKREYNGFFEKIMEELNNSPDMNREEFTQFLINNYGLFMPSFYRLRFSNLEDIEVEHSQEASESRLSKNDSRLVSGVLLMTHVIRAATERCTLPYFNPESYSGSLDLSGLDGWLSPNDFGQ